MRPGSRKPRWLTHIASFDESTASSETIERSASRSNDCSTKVGLQVRVKRSGSLILARALETFRWLLTTRMAKRTVRLKILAIDRDPTAVALARNSGLHAVRSDALRLPFGDTMFDMVMAVKFAHHFSGAGLVRLLAEMTRVSRLRVLVLDIRRHWLAYYGFIVWSRVVTRNRLVRYDGPLSVLRGFTAGELAELAQGFSEFEWDVRSYAGFQLALVGCRKGTDTSGRREITS